MADRKREEPADFEILFYEGVVRQRPDYVEALVPLAQACTRKGLYAKGMEVDERLARLCQDDAVVHYNLACSYALVGRKTDALKTLRRAVDVGSREFKPMRKDPDLKSLHGDPDFESLTEA